MIQLDYTHLRVSVWLPSIFDIENFTMNKFLSKEKSIVLKRMPWLSMAKKILALVDPVMILIGFAYPPNQLLL